MTFNLLEDQEEGSPNSWDKRKDICISVITSYSPMVLCTQQGVKSQLDYLQQCLPGYDQFGMSRKGFEDISDQYCTIFYDKEKVERLEGGTFWLSESPSVPGSMRSALLTWQHIASLPPSLPVVYCGGFNTQKESTTGRFLLGRSREHGVVGDMRDAWPNARVRKNVSLIRTYHGFKGDKQGAMEFLKLIFRALCLCWDRQTQDLHIDWVLFRGRSLIPVSCEVISDNIDGLYPSSHYPIFTEFMLPRTVRLIDPPTEDGS
ncbi:OLC1v1035555C1 [Oldenlandia corymbosa var. corymbosa]|uniref:OLC1v1035555C1 n=1 Tax=Oldenlandia corymbosa var. corymbosa TaxID=529605 RepID=A0AAV1CV54_OLDCO|nr:OLC1v1035555C1 [Oldenlandia corymbosa var. corymbosa]